MTRDASILFSPFRVGDLQLNNRLVMAPLTRNRATKGTDAPIDLNARYYRSSRKISQQGQGYTWTSRIYTEAQVAGWTKVTEAVHQAGGRIFIQVGMSGAFRMFCCSPAAPSRWRPPRSPEDENFY